LTTVFSQLANITTSKRDPNLAWFHLQHLTVTVIAVNDNLTLRDCCS